MGVLNVYKAPHLAVPLLEQPIYDIALTGLNSHMTPLSAPHTAERRETLARPPPQPAFSQRAIRVLLKHNLLPRSQPTTSS
eukprot:5674705-Amphidinium_carterae.1